MDDWTFGRGGGVRLGRPDRGGWVDEGATGVDWERVEDEENGGALIVVTLHEPEAGLWTVEANGAGLDEAAVEPLVAAGAAVPMLAVALAGIGDTPSPATGGTVAARVIAPDGGETSVHITDDGQQADGPAADGLHGLLSEDFATPGIHHATFRFNGTHPNGGMAVRRLARGSFTRAAPGGFIAEILGHRTVDADDDGYPEAVVVDVRVDVTEPGDFSLAGTLAEEDGGGSFDAVTEFRRSEAGAGVVNLVFDKRGLPMGRECGPFGFRELRLIRAEGEREWLHDYPASATTVNARLFNGFSRHLRVSGDLAMGWVKTGQSTTRTLRIHNDGWQAMLIGGLNLPDGFTGDFEGEIPAGGMQEVEVTFTPAAAGCFGGGFELISNANGGTVEQTWSGTGYDGILLDDWLAAGGVAEVDRGPLADPNGDGVPNLLAYLFNIPPVGGGPGDHSTALPTPRMGEDEAGRYLALRYRHHRRAEQLTVTLEACADPAAGPWQAITPDAIIDLGPDPATGDPIREFRMRITDQKGFVRLAVKLAQP